MTKYKVGEKVRVVSVDWINGVIHFLPLGADGVVTEIHKDTGHAGVEVGDLRQWVADEHIELITDPAPLRFSDVRTGDQITVAGGEYTITGNAWRRNGGVDIFGVLHFKPLDDLGAWVDDSGFPVKLTAHTPADEPEWHRAEVIEADIELGDDEGVLHTYLLPGGPPNAEWTDGSGTHWETDALTNVKIIVDEHGEMRA